MFGPAFRQAIRKALWMPQLTTPTRTRQSGSSPHRMHVLVHGGQVTGVAAANLDLETPGRTPGHTSLLHRASAFC